jgi:threonine/homoserine/homoserine lactone efflux protein
VTTVSALLAAWLAHLLAAASPGPSILLAARIGVTRGFATGLWLCLGLAVGALAWAIAALFGMAALFAVAPALLWAFKLAGAAFLIWIAWQMWRHAPEPLVLEVPGPARPAAGGSAFSLGLAAQLSNPKPAIFFGAVFIAAVPPGTPPAWLALLLLGVFLNEMLCTLAVARAFSLARPRAAYQRFKTAIDRTFGALLAALGVKLAAT